MKTYRRKPSPTFEAVRYTAATRDEIVALLNATTLTCAFTGDELIPVPGITLPTLHPFDWLIRDHDGSYSLASDDVFRATYEEIPELWCVHVQGPDTIIAQPDKATAEKRATEWNARLRGQEHNAARKRLGLDDIPIEQVINCVVAAWPYPAEGHAQDLAKHGGEPEDIC